MAATRDFYEVLGVSRDAGSDDIRKAYRLLARQNHPDVNGGDAAATERFKEINQAYEVLSNPEKRERYDRFGAAGVDATAGPGAGDVGGAGFGPFGDLFEMVFGAGGGRAAERGPERGADLRADTEVTLEEVLTGVTKTISVTRHERCDDCRGSGARAGTRPQTCVACAGSGYTRVARQTILGTFSQMSECQRCRGRGKIIADPCTRCRGTGQQRKTRQIPVEIPPGVEERTRMRITGEGEASPTGGPNGDLYVFLAVRPDRRFRREGQDLMCDVQVSFARAALGGAVRVATLEGDETLPIPDGTQPGDVFRLRGRGLPGLRRQERGDLHVMVRVATPTHLNDRQRKALEEFAAASGEDLGAAHPHGQNKGLIEWVRNLFTHKEEDETRERDGG